MKKIKKILIIFITMNTLAFAELSKEQLIQYSKVSWGVKKFKEIEDAKYDNLFIKLGIDNNISNLKKIEEMKKFAYCHHASKAFLDEIRKLTNEEYNEIISFYQSDLGKKLSQEHLTFSHSKVKSIYKTLKQGNQFSKEKKLLIQSITKQLNVIELKIQYEIRKLITKNFHETNQYYSEEYLKRYANQHRPIVKEYEEQKNIVMFRDFSINELKKILEFSKTQGAKGEIELLFQGMKEAYSNRIILCSHFVHNFIKMPNNE